VAGLDNGIDKAIERTYKSVNKIKFDHCFFRRDIGAKALGDINIVTR
jgi:phosphoribosylamine-glycine ligase